MKHHEYQIYYGGFKIKLKNWKYCETCDTIAQKNSFSPYHSNIVRSHKKQTGKPRG